MFLAIRNASEGYPILWLSAHVCGGMCESDKQRLSLIFSH